MLYLLLFILISVFSTTTQSQNTTAGATYCSALSLQCLNNGTINPATTTDCSLPLTQYTACSPDWYLPAQDYCMCPSGYTGVDCSLRQQDTCATNQRWSGNVVEYNDPATKSLICAINSTAGPAYGLKNHWLKMTVNDVQKTVTVDAYSQVASLTKADACTTTVDGFSCALSDCTIGPISNTNASIAFSCNTAKCTGCNDTDCSTFLYIADAFSNNRQQPLIITFDTIDTLVGTSSGTLIGVTSALAVNLPLNCMQGSCVQANASFGQAGQFVNLITPIANDTNGTMIVQTVVSVLLATAVAAIAFIMYRNRYTKYHQPFWRRRRAYDTAAMYSKKHDDDLTTSLIPLPARLQTDKHIDTTSAVSSDGSAVYDDSGKHVNNSIDAVACEAGTVVEMTGGVGLTLSDVVHTINGRNIIDHVTCSIPPTSLIALVGQSGAGKTTLLRLIAGQAQCHTGQIYATDLAGKPVTEMVRVGYVQQNDILLHTQTTREILTFSCRLQSKLTHKEIDHRVNAIMKQLQIDHIADVCVGLEGNGISGGERRRVSIGIELIAQPDVLLLDEPLSGLDSSSALQTLTAIQRVAHDSRITCILSIHQSSQRLLGMFDQVLALSRRGRVAYYDQPSNIEEYFTDSDYAVPPHMSISEYLLEVTSHHSDAVVDDIHTLYQSKHAGSGADTAAADTTGVPMQHKLLKASPARPFYIQLYELLHRSMRHTSRNISLLLVFYLVTTISSVFVGYLFYHVDTSIAGIQNRSGYFFFVLIYFSLTALTAIPAVIHDRLQLSAEIKSRLYTHRVYLAQYCLHDFVLYRIIPAVINTIICYYLVELNQHNATTYLQLMAVVVLVACTSSMLCICVAAIAPNIETANFMSICLIMYCLLFGGLLVNTTGGGLEDLSYLSYLHYAYEIMYVNEFSDLQFAVSGSGLPSVTVAGSTFVNTFGFKTSVVPINYGVIVSFLAALYIITYVALRVRIKA